MATRKIADLTQATTASDADLMVIQDTSKTKKITFATLLTGIKSKLGVGTAANLNTTSKEIVGAINEINTNLGVIGTLYTTEEVNTSTLYANNWYDIIGTLTLPPGTYLIVVNLQVTLKEIKIFDNNLNDFYFTQPNSNAISMILSKSNSMKIMIKGMPSSNITLSKSARYNFLQGIRIA